MIYIIVATKIEAQAFVERYKLKKSKFKNSVSYKNDNLHVIISGVGVEKAKSKAIELKEMLKSADKVLNVGIAGADKNFKIGECLKISKVLYKDNSIKLNEENLYVLTTVDRAVDNKEFKGIVDMEAFGIAKILKNFDLDIYKIVSDNFEPKKVTKDFAKKIIFKNLEKIL